jgi:hypothetical protein
MARNYQQAKIYCIKVNTEEEYLPYVGSSCKRLLSQRMNQHRDDYKKWKVNPEKYNFVSSFTLFEKYGIEECFIELLELFPCNCNDELRKKEREWIEKMECCNKVKRVIITEEENVEYLKIYYETHKEEILENSKIYYETHKEEKKIKYKNKKNELLEKRKEKYTCECDSICRKSDKARHEKTKKHQIFITDKNKTELLDRLEGERIELLNTILELNNKDN